MNDRSLRRYVLASLALTLAPTGCATLLGLDDFKEGPGPGVGGAGGSGGMSSSSSGTGGEATSSSTGGGCVDGATMACYSGPPNTVGVGQCVGGMATCQNSMYSLCVGDTLPMPEVCSTPGDENCDGIACSDVLWAQAGGDVSDQFSTSLATDAQGNTVIAGYFSGTLKLGTTSLISSGSGDDYFLAKFDKAGALLWASKYGTSGDNGNSAKVAIDKNGNITMAGNLRGTVNFGGATLVASGLEDVFVASFDSQGAHRWSKKFGDGSDQYATDVAVDSAGNVIITGALRGTLNFGGANLTTADAGDIFLAKLASADGAHLWSKRFGDGGGQTASDQTGYAVTVDSGNNITITGSFATSVYFGGATLLATSDSRDIFLAKFDSNGAFGWSATFETSANSHNSSGDRIATDSSGNILLAGRIGTATDFGGGSLPVQGGYNAYLAKFSAAGVHIFSKKFGLSGYASINGVTSDASDNIVIAGTFSGTADFGGGVITSGSIGNNDIFLAKLTGTGAYTWSKVFGDSAVQYPADVGIDAQSKSAIVMAASVQGTISFDPGVVVGPAGGYDVVLAKFQP